MTTVFNVKKVMSINKLVIVQSKIGTQKQKNRLSYSVENHHFWFLF